MSTAATPTVSPSAPSGALGAAREVRDDGLEIYRGYFETFDGLKLYYVRWTRAEAEASERPVIVLMHGFAEHVERYHEVAETLTAAGHPVVGIDARGHGRSDGPRAYVERFEDYVHDLRMLFAQVTARYPARKRVLLAHSHGGLIALRFVETHPEQVVALAMTSPLFGVAVKVPRWKEVASRVLTRALPKLTMPTEIAPEFVSRRQEIVDAYVSDPLNLKVATPRWFTEMQGACARALELAPEVRMPVFCLQAGGDRIVSPEATATVIGKLGSDDVTFEVVPDAYHELLNEPDRAVYLARLVAWIDERFPTAEAS